MVMTPPTRFPLVWGANPADYFAYRDAARVNVIDEKFEGDEQIYCMRRPGWVPFTLGWPVATGQGYTNFKGKQAAVIGDQLYWDVAPIVGASVTAGSVVIFTNTPWATRWDATGCAFNGRFYIIGGLNGGGFSDVWSTDNVASGTRWRIDVASAPWGFRIGARAVVHNNRMFFVGGVNPDTGVYHNDVWSTADGVDWRLETPAAAFNGRAEFGIVSYGGSMILTGGSESGGTNFDDVWSSQDGKAWTRVATASWGHRWGHSMLVFKNKLFVIGGVDAGVVQNNYYSSSDGGLTWLIESAAAFSSGRYFMNACIYDDKMWIISGTTDLVFTPSSHVYQNSTGTGAFTLVSAIFGSRIGGVCDVFPSPSSDPNPNVPTIYVCSGYTPGTGPLKDVVYMVPNVTAPSPQTLSPDVASLPYQMLSFQNGSRLMVKNASNLWSVEGTTPSKITDLGYPVETVPGIVALGGFLFVMDTTGAIYNCELDKPFKWPSLNVIGADFTDDEGVYLARYRNYVVALGQYTMQLFVDAGLSPGSPLRPYLNANTEIGCAAAETVAQYQDNLIWVSQNRDGERRVVMLDGAQPRVISNLAVEKSLIAFAGDNYGLPLQGCVLSIPGHSFYFLNTIAVGMPGNGQPYTWVYDLVMKEWLAWESSGFPTTFGLPAAADSGRALHPTNGQLFALDITRGFDGVNTDITCQWRSAQMDGGTMRPKFQGRTDLVGLQIPDASNPVLFNYSFSDDSGITYSTARTFDLRTVRPALFRNGTFIKRVHRLTTTDRNVFRVMALEMQLEVESM